MRRSGLLGAAVALVAVGIVALLLTRGGGDHPYLVRAVFDNASFVVRGEDVKVAGVTVGAIDSLDLTRDNKAVVVLRIDDPAYRPFNRATRCRIALQSLIGEQFVDCVVTGAAAGQRQPPLVTIRSGRGKGQHLLPVSNTTTPVGVDLLNNIMRVPQRERLRLIINELGAGLAANGPALREAIRRANPALQEADRLVAILAKQNEILAKLTDDSDAVLAPLARRRTDLSGFIASSGKTATATAREGDALEANFRKFPAFLAELTPAARRFGRLADEMSPAIQSLAAAAPAVNQATRELGPFTKSATPALTSLGKVAEQGRQTFPKIQPLARQLAALAGPLDPLASNLAKVSTNFDRAGGIESVMRFIYYYTGTVNGEDARGHYIRSGLDVAGACVNRVPTPTSSCEATFDKGASASAATAAQAQAATTSLEAQSALLDYLLGPDGR